MKNKLFLTVKIEQSGRITVDTTRTQKKSVAYYCKKRERQTNYSSPTDMDLWQSFFTMKPDDC